MVMSNVPMLQEKDELTYLQLFTFTSSARIKKLNVTTGISAVGQPSRNDPDVKSYNGPVINNLSKLYSRDAEAYSRKVKNALKPFCIDEGGFTAITELLEHSGAFDPNPSSLMSLHTYNPIGFGGDVASNLLAISDAVRIQGARTAGVVRGEEGGTGTGDCA
ncbi:hypothetical protein PInf_002646 [Phytophthora infestans]|nr:hypothetical protein PInf_002646 [Phytophthora infestans]